MILLGFIYQGLFGKRAYLRLMETEEVDLRESPWLYEERGLLVRAFTPRAVLGLEGLKIVRARDGSPAPESRLYLGDLADLSERHLDLSEPVSFRGVKIYQSRDWGYVLEFILLKPGEPHRRMFYFAENREGSPPFRARGDFLDTGYRLEVEFYPDLMHRERWQLKLPGARVRVYLEGREVFSGWVLFSQRVRLEEGTLYFAGISRWTAFILTASQGEPIFYTGFALAVLGGGLLGMSYFREGVRKI